MRKILVILGPTATGKTDLALQLAHKFQGELISADSRQVYKGLDIGTGKLPDKLTIENLKLKIKKYNGWWQINEVKIWMYDVVDLKKQYTVADFVKDAKRIVDEILKKGKLPIIVGGSGLYLKALLEGLPSLAIPVDKKLRRQLEKLSLEQLQKKLQKLSPEKWEGLNPSDRQNTRRLIRAVEIIIVNTKGERFSTGVEDPSRPKPSASDDQEDILKIGLTAPRKILNQKINKRAREWLEEGIIEEVRNLIKSGITKKRIKELGLEYAVIVEYLDKIISLDQCLKKMQSKVRQYAKRQITWFKNPSGYIFWFDITEINYMDKIEKLVCSWYDASKGNYVTEN